mgnify:CR=1 FL=1
MDSASLSQLEAELDKKRKGFQPGGVWEKNSSSTTSPYSSHISTHSDESFERNGGCVRRTRASVFALFQGVRGFGKQFECGHTRNFYWAAGPQKCLLGSLPKPGGLRDKLSQSPGAMRLLSAACRYRSWALFSRSFVTPSR